MSANNIVIEATNIAKCYRVFDTPANRLKHALWPRYTKGMSEVWALHDVSFSIKRGEAVAIIGRNGGGKSTLLEILTGTLTPSHGSVTVNGRVSALLELGSGFNPEFSGRDNVMLNGLLLGLKREEILARFDEIEAFAEIGAAIERPVKTYSSGMMMRLAFAVQVLCDPDILIIDEALSVGDFFFQQKCLGFIRGLLAKGTTLLFVSHDMGTVRDLCQRALYLKRGELAFDGERLEGISFYLSDTNQQKEQTNKIPSTLSEKNHTLPALPNLSHKYFWQKNPLSTQTRATLIGVKFENAEGNSATNFSCGDTIFIKTAYQIFDDKPYHVNCVIKNKYDQVLTVTGSYFLKTPLPEAKTGSVIECLITIKLDVEIGQYALQMSLGIPNSENVTMGEMIDETPFLGPITVSQNSKAHVQDFLGMVKLECAVDFLTGQMEMLR